MNNNWKTYRLGDIADIQTGPFGSQLHQRDYKKIGTPILTVENIGENKVIKENLRLVGDEDLNRLFKYTLQEGDILFSRVGYVDKRAYITKDEQGWLMSGSCLRIRITDKSFNKKYLSYLLGTDTFKKIIKGVAVGATRPSLNTSLLSDIELNFPELETQNKIALILSTLDNKIELNLKINQTLEAIAQTIFKRWFVDFQFPGSTGEMENELPKGWLIDEFRNQFNVERGLSYKGEGLSEKDEGIPMQNLNSIYEGGGYKYEGIKYYKGEFKDKHIVKPRDIIIANTEQGHKYLLIGFPAVVPFYFGDKTIFSHHIYCVRPNENSYLTSHFIYYLLLQPNVRDQIIGCTNGTTVNMLRIDGLQIPKFVLPDKGVVKKFSELIEPIWQRKENNYKENRTLIEFRDSLLPKLITGQIPVN